jgi:hypothetical protein
MSMKGSYAVGLLFLGAITALSCKDSNPVDGDSPSNIVFPTRDISFSQHVQPLFNQACALVGCHDDGAHQSQLNLTSHWNTVFALPGVVLPGHPESSTLIFRIEGTITPRMPFNRNPLNKNQTDGIRTWVVEGAKNN